MLTMVWLGLIGVVVGTFVIALGGGGAAIYLGILASGFHLSPAVAAATSIVTALPSIIIGTVGYFRQGKINFKIGNQMMVAALPAVVVGLLVSPKIPTAWYQWLLALILIGLGVQILVKRHASRPTQPNRFAASVYGVISGLMVGVAGLSGGGPVLAGLLLLGLDTFQATATSTYVLVGMSLLGAAFHLTTGNIYWTAGIPLIIGTVIGALLAPIVVKFLSREGHGSHLNFVIAGLLIFMGVKSLF
ncbi:sulfite exporter TauE/SafE family protein [Levilactobacillus acidifarinae]|uniref:Probable membrane transporter protein n=1 Tax=Levilactobacillus acidifarinae DSM 19394 = JCM 15949 TaxID=1423715 RepID=A0A0R1LQT8_9LACO|nr:sulfite exporter TauE/SafE family protein [Levilactobacillus acidifarinae]KRK95987.1 hypothetical protein FD25_GL002448 [Levilactobacillus acidifarinae DSM 19394]GEO69291.1 TauE [Levilactobacillus acidifarinae]